MSFGFWDVAMYASFFAAGVTIVHQIQRRRPSRIALSAGGIGRQDWPRDRVPVLDMAGLVDRTRTRAKLDSIRQLVRVPRREYERDFQVVLELVAGLVQALPHLPDGRMEPDGSLWRDALESLEGVLSRRPPREDVTSADRRYVLAVYVAALLVQIGPTLAAARVRLFASDPNASVAWTPLAGCMSACGGSYYRLEGTRAHGSNAVHRAFGSALLGQVVPGRVLRRIAESDLLYQELLECLAQGDLAPLTDGSAFEGRSNRVPTSG